MACKRATVSGDEGQTWGLRDDKLKMGEGVGRTGRESRTDRPGAGIQGKVSESGREPKLTSLL